VSLTDGVSVGLAVLLGVFLVLALLFPEKF
jgi:K+-transporting ATPase KdpF subunit